MPSPCHFPAIFRECRTRAGRPHAVSGRPMPIHIYRAVPRSFPCREPAVALRGRFQNSMVGERHGRGAAWERHGMSELALSVLWLASTERILCFIRLVHTVTSSRTVTTYRNHVTLPVTHTIQSYCLTFHPVPHAVTVSFERYTVGFRVCYWSEKARGADGGDVSRFTSRPAQAVTVSSLWCDGQITTAH
jgi:hypothetical protein